EPRLLSRQRPGAAGQEAPARVLPGSLLRPVRSGLRQRSPAGRLGGAAPRAQAPYRSGAKLVSFDMALAIDTYIAANLDTVARHQAAIRELSTPVIRVYNRVLLLPLVGTVDSHRAHQIMETLLTRVVDEQARVVIVDIAGVPVVDTRVADHLLKTTEAVRLVGAGPIITGISAQVARTIVQLGVDISAIHTRAPLEDGIERGLSL